MPVATEELKGEELEQWNACQSKVEELGFSSEEAVKFLNKAFAWQKGYWGPEKTKPEAPSTAQIDAVISYLDELGVTDKDLAGAIKQFPQLLGMKVEERMKPNITKIQNEFKIKGPAMKNVLKRKPQVLGFNWDCYGDCQGNCPRCWVHF
ncbi:hypothetical protein WJX84_010343 [Apatococcus fuscideae]|uniref:Uncharacterized protein n=1 Tax=Apatococcus fuscideae TaxID=2026836 RepID=A0AAW1SN84_9CHLO